VKEQGEGDAGRCQGGGFLSKKGEDISRKKKERLGITKKRSSQMRYEGTSKKRTLGRALMKRRFKRVESRGRLRRGGESQKMKSLNLGTCIGLCTKERDFEAACGGIY